MSAGAMVPIIAAGLQEKYIRSFREAGATSPATARTLDELGCRRSSAFGDLVRQGLFVEMDVGRYYLDTGAEEEFAARRRIGTLIALAIGGALLVAFVLGRMVIG